MATTRPATFKDYYSLTKPGVLYGNALTAVAGYLLASRGHIHLVGFLGLVVGTTFVIASACVLNNYLDQDIDQKMARTKKRAIVAGIVPGRHAVIMSAVLGVLGLLLLILYTNPLVVLIGVLGFIVYVYLYGMLSKRLSPHGTLVGSISGAAPILAGYCGASGRFDVGAIIVFLVLFFWQFPEFYAISIYRMKEYRAAGIPVISVVRGIPTTRLHIFWYTIVFVVSTILLTVFGYTGYIYLMLMLLLDGYWLYLAVRGLRIQEWESDQWAKRMFRFSLISLLGFCALISIGALLP